MEVINQIRGKRLLPNIEHDPQQIHLPEKLSHVSSGGGDIVFDQDFVFFFTYRGILENVSGYMYSEKGLEPGQSLIEHNSIYKLNNNWYWIGYLAVDYFIQKNQEIK